MLIWEVGESSGFASQVSLDGGPWQAVEGESMILRGLSAGWHNATVNVTDAGWWNPEAGQENIAGAYARAITVALALKERASRPQHRQDKIILVAHGTFIDCLLKAFVGAAPREGYYHWLYNGSLTRLDIIDSGAIIMRYTNRVSHLPPELVT